MTFDRRRTEERKNEKHIDQKREQKQNAKKTKQANIEKKFLNGFDDVKCF